MILNTYILNLHLISTSTDSALWQAICSPDRHLKCAKINLEFTRKKESASYNVSKGAIMINRSALIIKAKKPFLDWLRSLPDPADVTLDYVNRDNNVYLLPEYELDDEQGNILAQCYELIFEEELEGWWIVREDWPPQRDLKTFKKWFDIEFHSVVINIVDAPLEDE